MYINGKVIKDETIIDMYKPERNGFIIYGISKDGVFYRELEEFKTNKEMQRRIAEHSMKGFKVYYVKADKPTKEYKDGEDKQQESRED